MNILSNGMETSKDLKDFSDMFSLTSPANTATCTKSTRGTAIDIMLIKRPSSLKYTQAVMTGLNDCHKLISKYRTHFKRLPLKQENYICVLGHEMVRDSFYQRKEQCAVFMLLLNL